MNTDDRHENPYRYSAPFIGQLRKKYGSLSTAFDHLGTLSDEEVQARFQEIAKKTGVPLDRIPVSIGDTITFVTIH